MVRDQVGKGLGNLLGGLTLALFAAAPAQAADAASSAKAVDQPGEALLRQALALEHGEGVPQDMARAASIYCESARQGHPEAMYSLGWMYANGRGMDRNDAYAGTLFAMAAFLGHPQAARMTRFTGPYTGALPDCMHPVPGSTAGTLSPDKLIGAMSPSRREVARLLVQLAPKYGIQPELALAIALTESNLDPQALSPKSAMGVMQLIPATAERFNVTRPYDPEQNIRGGLAYLRWLLAYFEGDIRLAAAAYNAGEGAVNRHGGVPPYRETRAYVERIVGFVGDALHPFDRRVTAPSPALRKLRASGGEEMGS